MEMWITTLALLLVTGLSMAWHVRRGARGETGHGERRECPRCRGPIPAGAQACPACGVPLQAYELVLAPEARARTETHAALHAMVRADVCVGCGACVTACPVPGAIRLEGKLAVVDRGLCQGHGECVKACPVNGILLTTGEAVQRVEAPLLDVHFQSTVPGLYVVGELGGRGLIKNAVNEGRIACEHITARMRTGGAAPPGTLDVVVVGSGPAGLSAGLEAHRAGLRYVVLEQGDLSDTIYRYPRHKLLLAEPVSMPMYGRLWVTDASKEALLEVWRGIIARTGLDVRTGHRVERVTPAGDGFEVEAAAQVFRARNVVLAMGRRGNPRRLGVPGEERSNVFYDIVEMEAFAGSRVLVVGGGDSAVESAVGLANQTGTEVTLSYRGDAFARIKDRNRAKLEAERARGRITVLLRSQVREIQPGNVVLEVEGASQVLANDHVIVRIGGDAPFAFLRPLGIQIVTKEVALSPSRGGGAGAEAAVG
jgi:putative YpdA family bacillithiol system oxidoreductase